MARSLAIVAHGGDGVEEARGTSDKSAADRSEAILGRTGQRLTCKGERCTAFVSKHPVDMRWHSEQERGGISISDIQVMQSIYEALGRGDVPAILEGLHPGVEWEYDFVEHGIPWLVPRRGRAEVVKLFESLQGVEFHRFEPVAFFENGDQVFTTIRSEITVRATGKKVVDLEAHLFKFDAAGQVKRFRHFMDTHQSVMATQA